MNTRTFISERKGKRKFDDETNYDVSPEDSDLSEATKTFLDEPMPMLFREPTVVEESSAESWIKIREWMDLLLTNYEKIAGCGRRLKTTKICERN